MSADRYHLGHEPHAASSHPRADRVADRPGLSGRSDQARDRVSARPAGTCQQRTALRRFQQPRRKIEPRLSLRQATQMRGNADARRGDQSVPAVAPRGLGGALSKPTRCRDQLRRQGCRPASIAVRLRCERHGANYRARAPRAASPNRPTASRSITSTALMATETSHRGFRNG